MVIVTCCIYFTVKYDNCSKEQNGINNKLLNETVAAYNEIYRLIENNGYALIPKAPAFLLSILNALQL